MKKGEVFFKENNKSIKYEISEELIESCYKLGIDAEEEIRKVLHEAGKNEINNEITFKFENKKEL